MGGQAQPPQSQFSGSCTAGVCEFGALASGAPGVVGMGGGEAEINRAKKVALAAL